MSAPAQFCASSHRQLNKAALEMNEVEGGVVDVPEAYLGVWQRLLLRTPTIEDTTTEVYWLQTKNWHADIRIPVDRPACAGKTSVAELDHTELLGLSNQQGFAGLTEVIGDTCQWHRKLDYQAPSAFPDIGRMKFETSERVLEYGMEQDYFEIWQRLPDSIANPWVDICTPDRIHIGIGKYFMNVRPRSVSMGPLLPSADITMLRNWLDFEISFGIQSGDGIQRILRSTLPWREGLSLRD
jgi:hypothetical protein